MLELYQKQFPNIEQDCSVLMRYLTGQVSFGNFHSFDAAKVIATAALRKAASEIKKKGTHELKAHQTLQDSRFLAVPWD